MPKLPVTQRIRVESVGQVRSGVTTPERSILRFSISADLIDELFRLHDELYKVYFFHPKPKLERYREHRIEFARLADIRIPVVLMRIEPPNYNPHGHRFRQPKGHIQYRVQVQAKKLRVRDDLPMQDLEFFVAPEMRGIMVNFPDEAMIFPGDKMPALRPLQEPIAYNEQDMAVYSGR
jgi:hypothetical protein